MLGYVSAKQALKDGFTHHGSYFGFPIWLKLIDPDGIEIAAKWIPVDFVIPIISWIEVTIRQIVYPNEEPVFQFMVGGEIKKNKGE